MGEQVRDVTLSSHNLDRKERTMVARALFLFVAAFASGLNGCQRQEPQAGGDPVKVAPAHYKVLLENDRVRALEFRTQPGEKTPRHSHPAYLVYDLTGGSMKFTSPDGEVFLEEDRKPGDVSWSEAKTHASENVGSTEARALIVELK
jgi:quercetin dioxygenase-like cupin family protein